MNNHQLKTLLVKVNRVSITDSFGHQCTILTISCRKMQMFKAVKFLNVW